MNLLGLDTATGASAVCLLRGDGRAFEVVPPPSALTARPGHAGELMPAVAFVLEQAALRFGDLDALAVGVGPGAFTGLRIGISTVRAIAAAQSLPVRPVSSLAALAAGADADTESTLAVIDARRGEAFAALHRGGEELWRPFVADPGTLAERIRAAGVTLRAVGDGAIRFRDVLEAAGARVAPDDSPLHVIRALHVCRLGSRAPAAAPEAVLPDYLRLPDVTAQSPAARP